MYARTAYLDGQQAALVDNKESLIVSSGGQYRLKTRRHFETNRPAGRPDYQLLYIAAGTATFFFDGQPQTLGAGTAILYQPGQSQHYIYRAKEQPEVYWVHFTGRDVQARLTHYGLGQQQILYAGSSVSLTRLFDAMIRELQLCRPLYRELLPRLLEELFLLMCRQRLEENSPTTGEIWDAVAYFQKHYAEPIRVSDYAKDRHMSSAWFIHRFKQATGLPPMQYLQNLRLNTARSLLEGTDCSVAQAAAIAGFTDPLYFSRLFKKRLGISPTEYRKRHEKAK